MPLAVLQYALDGSRWPCWAVLDRFGFRPPSTQADGLLLALRQPAGLRPAMIAGIGLPSVATEAAASACPHAAASAEVVSAGHHHARSLLLQVVDPAARRSPSRACIASARLGTGTIPAVQLVREVLQVRARPHSPRGNACRFNVFTDLFFASGSLEAAARPRLRLNLLVCGPPLGLALERRCWVPAAVVRPGSTAFRDRRPGGPHPPGLIVQRSMLPLGALDGGPGRPNRRPSRRGPSDSQGRRPGRWVC